VPRIIRRILHRLVLHRFGFGHPVPKPALDDEYRRGHWDHFGASAEAARYECLAGLVGEFSRPPRAVLDVGCGSGHFAARIAGPGVRYLGVDLSTEGLARARLRNPGAEFVAGDFESWRPPGQWDVIVFNETIGYAHDPGSTIGSFAAHLSASGILAVSLYQSGNHQAIWRRILRRTRELRHERLTVPGSPRVWDVRALAPRGGDR
jgi:trans-aconitate methyltransferase